MFQSLESQLSFVALFVCCGLALWKGGSAERSGGVMILVTWIGSTVIQAMAKAYVVPIVFLASDAVLAAGLLFLAIRFSSLWLGAAMLLQAIGLSLHAAYFAADKTDINVYALWLYIAGKNAASYTMLLVILAATLASMRRRRRARGASDPAPALPSRAVTT
ncbi:MAG TPA: hypothetical protein VGM25_04415 [Caulobacteraceae bacterium]|jgi:hypothetical protein